jgi:hypothetical protein
MRLTLCPSGAVTPLSIGLRAPAEPGGPSGPLKDPTRAPTSWSPLLLDDVARVEALSAQDHRFASLLGDALVLFQDRELIVRAEPASLRLGGAGSSSGTAPFWARSFKAADVMFRAREATVTARLQVGSGLGAGSSCRIQARRRLITWSSSSRSIPSPTPRADTQPIRALPSLAGSGPGSSRPQDRMNSNRSALIVSAWVVGMPWGNPA